jgi:hypothetical protein
MMSNVNIPVQERGTSQVLFNHTPTAWIAPGVVEGLI